MPIIKLDKGDVKRIKQLLGMKKFFDREIAEMFGVSRKHINAIKNNKRWNYGYGEETNSSQEEISRYFEK